MIKIKRGYRATTRLAPGMNHAFADRTAAGRQLGRVLAQRNFPDPVVLALPRGGVPVAEEVALALHAPLDLLVVRKIGAPRSALRGLPPGKDDEVIAGIAGAAAGSGPTEAST